MNSFEAGFYKEAIDQGLSETRALELMKIAMGFSGATPLFNHESLDGQADPQQLQLMHSMHQQALAEQQMQQMHSMLGAQQMAEAPIGGPQ